MIETGQTDTSASASDAAAEPAVNDLMTGQESEARLSTKARRALRRRLLKSANLKTLWGTVDIDVRLIIETLSGEIHPRNGDVISRMLERHSHMLERARQDDHRQQIVEALEAIKRTGVLPVPQIAGALTELGVLPEAAGDGEPSS